MPATDEFAAPAQAGGSTDVAAGHGTAACRPVVAVWPVVSGSVPGAEALEVAACRPVVAGWRVVGRGPAEGWAVTGEALRFAPEWTGGRAGAAAGRVRSACRSAIVGRPAVLAGPVVATLLPVMDRAVVVERPAVVGRPVVACLPGVV